MSTLDTMCGELCAAMLNDEHGGGVDISSGLYGEETSIWIKQVASNHDVLTVQRDTLRDALIELMDIVNVDTVEAVEAKIYAAQAALEQLK